MSSDLRSLLADAAGPGGSEPEIDRWWRKGRRRRAARRVALAGGPALVGIALVATAVVQFDQDDEVRVGDAGPTTSADRMGPCGSELPLKATSTPYGRPQRAGRAPVRLAPEVGAGQVVIHWSDGGDRAIELRWPSSPALAKGGEMYDISVAGRPATVGERTRDGLRQIVRVELSSDDEDRCSELSVEGYGTIDDQVTDELSAFVADALVDASAPLPTPATTPAAAPACLAPSPRAGAQTVRVFLYCRDAVTPAGLVPVERAVAETQAVLGAALEQLLAGTTPEEEAAGFVSGVPEQVVGAPVIARIDADGVAFVDVEYDFSTVNNFSTSGMTLGFVDPIYATAFQFETVTAIDLGAFCGYTELACSEFTRPEWERQVSGG